MIVKPILLILAVWVCFVHAASLQQLVFDNPKPVLHTQITRPKFRKLPFEQVTVVLVLLTWKNWLPANIATSWFPTFSV
jgi:hypothetical protein